MVQIGIGITAIVVIVALVIIIMHINQIKWKKNGTPIAGGHGSGSDLNQLRQPQGLFVDNDNTIYIVDYQNHRIVQWKSADTEKNEVRRWTEGEDANSNGTIVAGGNDAGNNLNQLNSPSSIFVDENYSVYISDHKNHRIMKWRKGAQTGMIVAGGSGQICVGDCANHRVVCWNEGSSEGTIVAGGIGPGESSDKLSSPTASHRCVCLPIGCRLCPVAQPRFLGQWANFCYLRHCLRLSLSTSYRPLVWPLSDLSTLTIYFGQSSPCILKLPRLKEEISLSSTSQNDFTLPEVAQVNEIDQIIQLKMDEDSDCIEFPDGSIFDETKKSIVDIQTKSIVYSELSRDISSST
ncbi:unnamed protein product [Adineta ricciae]|uniref:Uncharacterized protein n=1 Tax=Adineta ricciae TaxID=249248 RepID=A0A815LEQ8_ADIRI|nr:unnamed protein product [Adineta ricciae]